MILIVRMTLALLLCCLALMSASEALGRILPYGGEIAFEDAADGASRHIYLVDVHHGTTVNLTRGVVQNANQPAWSPDGRWLAFTSIRCNACGNFVYLLDMSTHEIRQLTDVFGTINLDLNWSPDGERLTMTGALDRTLHDPGGVYTVDIDDGEFRLVSPDTYNEVSPIWSPDSRQIAFMGTTPTSAFSMFVVHADGSNLRRLSRVNRAQSRPSWSPDSQRLVIARSDTGIHVVTLGQQGSEADLFIGPGLAPIWSPQGDTIAFMSPSAVLWSSNQLGSILIVGPEGTKTRALSDFDLDLAVALTWSPNGNRLAFISYCDENAMCVFVMELDSGHLWRAARYQRMCRPEDCRIAWRPI